VDVRGSGASFGTRPWDYGPDEIVDASNLADWIVRQPWSNGRISTAGASYTGSTAEFALINRNPAIVSAINISSEFDQYTDILFPGGVQLGFYLDDWGASTSALDRNEIPGASWTERLGSSGVATTDDRRAGTLRDSAVREHAANYDFRELKRFTFRDDFLLGRADSASVPTSIVLARQASEASAFRWLQTKFGPEFRSRGIDVASQHAYLSDIAAADVPMYAIAGWFDGTYANAMIHRFKSYPNRGTRLLIGPWDHQQTNISPFSGGAASRFDLQGEILRFLDGTAGARSDTALSPDQRVLYYVMGDEQWRSAASWPPASRATRLYFSAEGALAERAPSDTAGADPYTVDFSTGTGRNTRWNTLVGRRLRQPYDDRARRDSSLRVYEQAPLATDVEVTGHPLVHLAVRSNASDGAFFAYLEDVWPDGHVTMVTEGQLRAQHRQISVSAPPFWMAGPYHTFRKADAAPLVPGVVSTLDFELEPTSYVFRRGHRIRIALAGADQDHFTPVPSASNTPVTVEFLRSAQHASFVVLPVVPRNAP
jgi:putative CocE/NonD family hydrolase